MYGVFWCYTILINGIALYFVEKNWYLGFTLTYNLKDDIHIENLYRGLCIRSNTILRNFSKCTKDVKILLFQSYCQSFYCLSLVFRVRLSDMQRLRVCYNNSLRRLFNLGRQTSISQFCVRNAIPTFSEIRHKGVVGLLHRLKMSGNNIIKNIVNVNYLFRSQLFVFWKPVAFAFSWF